MSIKIVGKTMRIDRRQIEFNCREIPKERFVEYEPCDLDWMIPLGLAPVIKIPDSIAEQIKVNGEHWQLMKLGKLLGFDLITDE